MKNIIELNYEDIYGTLQDLYCFFKKLLTYNIKTLNKGDQVDELLVGAVNDLSVLINENENEEFEPHIWRAYNSPMGAICFWKLVEESDKEVKKED